MAEKFLMVEINGGDDGDLRLDDVGGVEAASEADFVDGEFDLGADEMVEGHGGEAFEEGGVRRELAGGQQLLDERVDAGERGSEIVVVDFQAVDANALVDALQVRRGVEAGAGAGGVKDGFEDRSGRSLAVGAGDVDAGDGAVGRAETLGEAGDVFEVELLDVRLARRGKLFAEGEKIMDGVVVVHPISSRLNVSAQLLCGIQGIPHNSCALTFSRELIG